MNRPTPSPAAIVSALLGAVLFLVLVVSPVRAGSATWTGTASKDLNNASNWTAGGPPNDAADVATFSTSNNQTVAMSASIDVDSIVFGSDADAYTLNVSPANTLTLYGTGVTNSSNHVQNFNTLTNGTGDFGTISFDAAATAGGNTTYTNQGSSNGFNLDGNQYYSSYGGGITQFFDTASAGRGTFTNQGGTDSSNAGGGTTVFHNSASAGSGSFYNEGSSVVAGYGGLTVFNDTSSAGSGTFTNESGPAESTRGGYTVFNDTADAGTGTFITNGGMSSGTMGSTVFNNSSTAGSANFTVNGAGAAGGSGGYVIFNDTASAASGVFTLNGGADGAEGGNVQFWGGTTADQATFTVNGGSVANGGGSYLYFTSYVAGYGSIVTPATAANGTYTVNGGSASGASGGYIGFENATAAQGTFTVNGASVSGAGGGLIAFYSYGGGTATADQATFTVNGGSDATAAGGLITFNGPSTAGDSTLIANGGTNGGDGGTIRFLDSADGANAAVQVYDNGSLDISTENVHLGTVTVSIGSLEGSGYVSLGDNNLSVGGRGSNTIFSGVLQDNGFYGSGTGSLTKVGTGALQLSGANTYTGPTMINGGKLIVTGSIASSSLTTVNDGGTLIGTGAVGGLSVEQNGILSPGFSLQEGHDDTERPGTLSAGDTTLKAGGIFNFRLNQAADGVAGTNWSLLASSTSITLTADAETPFLIQVTSLGLDDYFGQADSFDPNSSYHFTFATSVDGVTGFDSSAFAINTDNFQNAFTGTWSVSSDGFNLSLDYTAGAPVPEPATYAVIAGLGALGLAAWRRRRTAVMV